MFDLQAAARAAFRAYGKAVGGVNVAGNPLPPWEALGETVQEGWLRAAGAVVDTVLAEERDTPARPAIGRIVLYTLTSAEATAINDLRLPTSSGHSAGNRAEGGQVYPAVVVGVFDPSTTTANLQVLLDGNDTYWATSRTQGDGPSHWAWPPD